MRPENGRVACETVADAPSGLCRVVREARCPSSHTCRFESCQGRVQHHTHASRRSRRESRWPGTRPCAAEQVRSLPWVRLMSSGTLTRRQERPTPDIHPRVVRAVWCKISCPVVAGSAFAPVAQLGQRRRFQVPDVESSNLSGSTGSGTRQSIGPSPPRGGGGCAARG